MIFGVYTPSDILPIGKVLVLIRIKFKGLDTSCSRLARQGVLNMSAILLNAKLLDL